LLCVDVSNFPFMRSRVIVGIASLKGGNASAVFDVTFLRHLGFSLLPTHNGASYAMCQQQNDVASEKIRPGSWRLSFVR
jgi:hypothetical protein